MSASGTDGLAESDIWRLGDKVGENRAKTARARADFRAGTVDEIQANGVRLVIEPDPQPHDPRHVNVCGWPLDQDLRLSIAQEFCCKSVLRVRQESS